MNKCAALLTIGLVLAPVCQPQEDQPLNPEMQRQEIINLESEAARAIQQSNGTFFRRVYSDDFSGTLSHGQPVNKALWIDAVQSALIKYDTFIASDIKVRIYQDTAVATCMWSSRAVYRGQRISSQMRVVHVYVNSPRGWHVVGGQATLLPPNVEQPL
jgi:hypothetical protein